MNLEGLAVVVGLFEMVYIGLNDDDVRALKRVSKTVYDAVGRISVRGRAERVVRHYPSRAAFWAIHTFRNPCDRHTAIEHMLHVIHADDDGYGGALAGAMIRDAEDRKRLIHSGNGLYANDTTSLVCIIGGGDSDDVQSLRLLLRFPGISITDMDHYGHTVLSAACTRGNFRIVQEVMRVHTDAARQMVRSFSHFKLFEQFSPIHFAAANGHSAILHELLRDEYADFVDPNTRSLCHNSNNIGRSALSWACSSGDVNAVRILLECSRIDISKGIMGDDPSLFEDEFNPLYVASGVGHLDTVRLLLKWPEFSENKKAIASAISIANSSGFSVVADLLLGYMPVFVFHERLQ